MALPTNTATLYDLTGEREDLSNTIYDISPTQTPVVSMLSRVPATARLHEWQTDALAAAAANAKLEGDDPTAQTVTSTTRLNNYCQILEKTVIVSESSRAMDTAGRADELDYQAMKIGEEVKRDIELAVTQNQSSSVGGSGTARQMGSIESWLKSTGADASAPYTTLQARSAASTAATSAGWAASVVAAPTDGTLTGLVSEGDLQAVIRQSWVNGGEPSTVVCGPFNKQKISAFPGIATQQRDNPRIEQAKIIAAADLYVSDFGEHAIIPDRFNRDRTILVLDMNFWALAEARPFTATPLAKTGDNEKIMVVTELTLEARNPLSSGKIADCDTA